MNTTNSFSYSASAGICYALLMDYAELKENHQSLFHTNNYQKLKCYSTILNRGFLNLRRDAVSRKPSSAWSLQVNSSDCTWQTRVWNSNQLTWQLTPSKESISLNCCWSLTHKPTFSFSNIPKQYQITITYIPPASYPDVNLKFCSKFSFPF